MSLEVWTVDTVAACKAFKVAREAVRIRNSTKLPASESFLIHVVTVVVVVVVVERTD